MKVYKEAMSQGRKIKRIEPDYLEEIMAGRLAIHYTESHSWAPFKELLLSIIPNSAYTAGALEKWYVYHEHINLWKGYTSYDKKSIHFIELKLYFGKLKSHETETNKTMR